jgi:crossover junction endodeoxyribonuclease RuvC
MIILGIDPSLRGTGWGIVDRSTSKNASVFYGTIRNSASITPSRCLVEIHSQLSGIISTHKPTVVAIEGIFYAQNIRTALTMGQARGAAILAAASAGLEVYEYAPRRVKQSVVGKGGAAKNQVGFMVRALLGLKETPEPDAADALAIALTHLNSKNGIVEKTAI